MARVTKEAFISKQMRGPKKRSRAQAEADWTRSQRMKKRKRNPAKKKAAAKKSGSAPKRSPAKKKAAAKRSSNPGAGTATVLLMNPYGSSKKKRSGMAKRRKRRKSTKKRARRRNPAKKWDVAGVGIAAVGGGAVAGGTFLLDGTAISPDWQNIGVLAGSAALGLALSKHAPSLGKGIAGAGLGIGVLGLLRTHVAPPFGEHQVVREKTERETAAVRARLGRQSRSLMMNAVKTQLGCTRSCPCDQCQDFRRCRMAELVNLQAVRARLPSPRPAPMRRETWETASLGMV